MTPQGTQFKHLIVSVMLCVMLLTGCSGRDAGTGGDDAAPALAPAVTKVPVKMARVRKQTMDVVVTAPGETETLRKDRIRAPFASRLSTLRVSDGDRVTKGQVIAVIVAKDSEAALSGAKQMLADAKTSGERADARRAVEMARRQLVEKTLVAPADGVVVSHSAEAGDYVDANEILLTIAETSTLYFKARVAQSDVAGVKPGQPATIQLPAHGPQALKAVVKGLLPMASSQDFSAPVRLDFTPSQPALPTGLFGTVRIVVARHEDATVVPVRSVLRDDVTGVTRVAVVRANGTAHWLTVDEGVREGGVVEIKIPAIATGTRVVTDGQVGLPEGARVVQE